MCKASNRPCTVKARTVCVWGGINTAVETKDLKD